MRSVLVELNQLLLPVGLVTADVVAAIDAGLDAAALLVLLESLTNAVGAHLVARELVNHLTWQLAVDPVGGVIDGDGAVRDDLVDHVHP